MKKHIYDEQTGLHYELVDDYYLPCITAPELPELGIWGRRRLNHLRTHQKPIYTGMLLSGTLGAHLQEIDRTAAQRYTTLIQQMTETAGITEELKATDQLAWVQQMNSIDPQVREMINEELINANI